MKQTELFYSIGIILSIIAIGMSAYVLVSLDKESSSNITEIDYHPTPTQHVEEEKDPKHAVINKSEINWNRYHNGEEPIGFTSGGTPFFSEDATDLFNLLYFWETKALPDGSKLFEFRTQTVGGLERTCIVINEQMIDCSNHRSAELESQCRSLDGVWHDKTTEQLANQYCVGESMNDYLNALEKEAIEQGLRD